MTPAYELLIIVRDKDWSHCNRVKGKEIIQVLNLLWNRFAWCN